LREGEILLYESRRSDEWRGLADCQVKWKIPELRTALIDTCPRDTRLSGPHEIYKASFKARSKGESYATFRDSSALPSNPQRCSEKSNERAPLPDIRAKSMRTSGLILGPRAPQISSWSWNLQIYIFIQILLDLYFHVILSPSTQTHILSWLIGDHFAIVRVIGLSDLWLKLNWRI